MTSSLQRSFATNSTLFDRLFDLLEVVFPDLPLRSLATIARDLGAPWEFASTPFMKFHGERAIAHVGVLELPLQILGEPVTVGGIHAVATHPDYRRQGHYRNCMTAALEYCDRRYQTLLLTTLQPHLYEPFGFRVVREHAFVTRCAPVEQRYASRVLDLQNQGDCILLHRLLDTRKPVSDIVGVRPEKAIFFVNEATQPLHYVDALDTLLVMEVEQNHLHLFDVVTSQSSNCEFTFHDILASIAEPITEATIYFSGDRFNLNAEAMLHRLEDTNLMVRGSFAAEDQLFMLPQSARC